MSTGPQAKDLFYHLRQSKKQLSLREIARLNDLLGQVSLELFKVGRKVVTTEWHYGLPAESTGWIMSEWPATSVFFEFMDGWEFNMHLELAEKLQVLDEFISEDELLEKIDSFAGKRARVSRKSQYEE
jgi:hypothetical protein